MLTLLPPNSIPGTYTNFVHEFNIEFNIDSTIIPLAFNRFEVHPPPSRLLELDPSRMLFSHRGERVDFEFYNHTLFGGHWWWLGRGGRGGGGGGGGFVVRSFC